MLKVTRGQDRNSINNLMCLVLYFYVRLSTTVLLLQWTDYGRMISGNYSPQ